MLLPRTPSAPPGSAGPVRSVTRVPAGQMEAATFDIFRNLKWCQCDWLRCVYKRAKGTRVFIMAYISSTLPFTIRVELSCHLLDKGYTPANQENKRRAMPD